MTEQRSAPESTEQDPDEEPVADEPMPSQARPEWITTVEKSRKPD